MKFSDIFKLLFICFLIFSTSVIESSNRITKGNLRRVSSLRNTYKSNLGKKLHVTSKDINQDFEKKYQKLSILLSKSMSKEDMKDLPSHKDYYNHLTNFIQTAKNLSNLLNDNNKKLLSTLETNFQKIHLIYKRNTFVILIDEHISLLKEKLEKQDADTDGIMASLNHRYQHYVEGFKPYINNFKNIEIDIELILEEFKYTYTNIIQAYKERQENRKNIRYLEEEEKVNIKHSKKTYDKLIELKEEENLSREETRARVINSLPHLARFGLAQSMPPRFCWRNTLGSEYIPDKCPLGYIHGPLDLECYQDCQTAAENRRKHDNKYKMCEGPYYLSAGFCRCSSHMFRSFLLSYDKKPPLNMERLTNWNKDRCRSENDWHHGGLCYTENCEKRMPGFKNCGIGACSVANSSCKDEVINMVFGTIGGAAKLALFILTLGASAPLNVLLNNVGNNMAQKAIKTSIGIAAAIVKEAAQYATGKILEENENKIPELSPQMKKDGTEYAAKVWNNDLHRKKVLDLAKSAIYEKLKNDGIEKEYLNGIDEMIDKQLVESFELAAGKKSSTEEKIYNLLDKSVNPITIIKNAMDSCKSNDDDSGKIKCAKTWMEVASKLDPTGLVGIASLYMYPKCKETKFWINEESDIGVNYPASISNHGNNKGSDYHHDNSHSRRDSNPKKDSSKVDWPEWATFDNPKADKPVWDADFTNFDYKQENTNSNNKQAKKQEDLLNFDEKELKKPHYEDLMTFD